MVKKTEGIPKLRSTQPRDNMLEMFNHLEEIFNGPKTDGKQLDITNMPELESEKSVAQRRNQLRQGLKFLTPNQMPSRLPINLAQLKAGNNSKKNLKTKLGNHCILCTDQKNLQKIFKKVWLKLSKTWKQFL